MQGLRRVRRRSPRRRPSPLVSNTGQTGAPLRPNLLAGYNQPFTTGPTRYVLTSVDVAFSNVVGTSLPNGISIRARNNDGSAGTKLGDLTVSGAQTANRRRKATRVTFASSAGIQLEANTTYYFQITAGGSSRTRLLPTTSNAEDAGAASGWSIGDGYRVFLTGFPAGFVNTHSLRMTIRGYAAATVTVSSADSIVEGANLTLGLKVIPDPAEGERVATSVTVSAKGSFGLAIGNYNVNVARGGTLAHLTTDDDGVDEADGSATIVVNPGRDYAPGDPVEVTIRDNDPTIVSLARTGAGRISEGGTTAFTVTLGRALVAGEIIDVPLSIDGTDVTTDDWSLTRKTGGSLNTGVTLSKRNTAAPRVRFSGAGAQVATLVLTATADGVTESSEAITVALGQDGDKTNFLNDPTLGTNVGGGANPHGSNNAFEVGVNADRVVTVTVDSDSVVEGGAVTFNLTMIPAPPPGETVSVSVTVSQQGAFGVNVTPRNFSFTGAKVDAIVRTLNYGTHDDEDDEADGSATLVVNPGSGYGPGDPSSATVTITDNDLPIVGMASVTPVVTEGAEAGFKLTVGRAQSADLDVKVSVDEITGDFLADDDKGERTVTIPAGKTKATFTVPTVQNSTPEVNGFITLNLAPSPDDYRLGPNGISIIIVKDNDTPTLTASSATASEASGSRAVTLTATRSEANTSGEALLIPIRVKAQGTTAVAADYTLSATALSIADGATTGTATFTVTDDSADEPAETVVVELGALPAGTVAGSDSEVTLTIADDDATEVVLSRTGSGAVSEGRTVAFTVTLGRALVAGEIIDVPLSIDGTGVTVADLDDLMLAAGSALNKGVSLVDAGTLAPVVRFTGHATDVVQVATLELVVTEDSTPEGRETLTVALGPDDDSANGFDLASRSTNVGGGVNPSTTPAENSFEVRIPLNDGFPVLRVTVSNTVFERHRAANCIVFRTGNRSADLPFRLEISQTGDFVGTGSTNSFGLGVHAFILPATRSSRPYEVALNNDREDEADGTVTCTLLPGPGYALSETMASDTGRVEDNDPTIVSLSRTGSGAINEGQMTEFTVTLGRALVAGEIIGVPLSIDGTGVTTGDWSLALKTGNSLNTGVTLTGATTATPQLRFAGAGAETATLVLTATADSATESAETITVALGPDGDGTNGFDRSGRGTNVGGGADPDDDAKSFDVTVSEVAPALVFVPAEDVAVDEGGTASYTVALATAPSSTVTVTIASDDAAAADVDTDTGMNGRQRTLMFTTATWEDAQSVTVTGVEDDDDATDEDVTLTHSAAGGGYGSVTGTVDVTVTDDEQPTVSLSVSNGGAASEGGAQLTLTATRSAANTSGGVLAIPIRVRAQGTTAQVSDYTLPATISIANGESTGTATFTVTDDSTEEPVETVVVELGNLPAGTRLGDPAAVTIIIADDDAPVTVTFPAVGLVSNLRQPRSNPPASLFFRHLQAFTTGSSPSGYTLSAVDVRFEKVVGTSISGGVSIRPIASPGTPGVIPPKISGVQT